MIAMTTVKKGSLTTNQSGNTLIISLLLLVVIGLGAKSVLTSLALDSQVTRHFEERDITFQAAEQALRQIEAEKIRGKRYIEHDFSAQCVGADCFTANCTNSLCKTVQYEATGGYNCAPEGTRVWENETLWANANQFQITLNRSSQSSSESVAVTIQYLIEFRCYIPRVANPQVEFLASEWMEYYRVTVRATGPSGNAKITLQSSYQRG